MKIIVCGSMTVSKEMVRIVQELKELGYDVMLPEFTHDYAVMETLDKMHTESVHNKVQHSLIKRYYEKIKEGDAVLIVNVEKNGIPGYIGGNTFLEMGFVHVLGKNIYLLNKPPKVSYRDEIDAMQPVVLDNDFSKIIEKIKTV